MAMIPSGTSRSFAEIRQNLEPGNSYIILEDDAGTVTKKEIIGVFEGLPLKAGDLLATKLYRETHTRRLIVVARLARDRGERIKARIMSSGIASHMALYFYGSSPDRGRHDVERL